MADVESRCREIIGCGLSGTIVTAGSPLADDEHTAFRWRWFLTPRIAVFHTVRRSYTWSLSHDGGAVFSGEASRKFLMRRRLANFWTGALIHAGALLPSSLENVPSSRQECRTVGLSWIGSPEHETRRSQCVCRETLPLPFSMRLSNAISVSAWKGGERQGGKANQRYHIVSWERHLGSSPLALSYGSHQTPTPGLPPSMPHGFV